MQYKRVMSRNCMDKKSYTMYNETLYEVERVIQMKWIKNRQYCLIKWKGYDERFNTWEPKEHITFCLDYISTDDKKDPQYQDKPVTPSAHQYQTRAKKNHKEVHETAKIVQTEEKEDTTFIGEQTPENLQNVVKEKQVGEANNDNFQIRKRGDEWKAEYRKTKDSLVSHVLSLGSQNDEKGKGKGRIAKVQMVSGAKGYMSQATLKQRFPDKVIEFYEQKMSCKVEADDSD